MLQKAYSVAYLVADILFLLLKILVGIMEAIYTTFVPPKEKSVSGEVVLVIIFFNYIFEITIYFSMFVFT